MQPDTETITAQTCPNMTAIVASFQFIFDAIIGVHDFERTALQPIHIYLITENDNESVSERALQNHIADFIAENKPKLLETMAYKLALSILTRHHLIKKVTLTIRKPRALSSAACAFVTVAVHRQAKGAPHIERTVR